MGLADELSEGKEKNNLRNISTFKRREGVIELKIYVRITCKLCR